jgi:hypothetical protein
VVFGDGLRRKRRSQQSFNPRRNRIVELVERRVLLKNAFSQEPRVGTDAVVDGAEFEHINPQVPSNGNRREEASARKVKDLRWPGVAEHGSLSYQGKRSGALSHVRDFRVGRYSGRTGNTGIIVWVLG